MTMKGTFSEMGIDIPATIRHFGGERIHFVHFRDVIGDSHHFTETFQDEGQTNMLEAMRAWRGEGYFVVTHNIDVGFKGPIRPDHVPLLVGEEGHLVGDKAKGYFSGKASGIILFDTLIFERIHNDGKDFCRWIHERIDRGCFG
jgi:D-mannonate dehydratase